MSIFEFLSFDIKEFATSIEGICIIVGILLLILGIIFALSTKGKKKEVVADNNNAPTAEPVASENIPAAITTPAVEPAPVVAESGDTVTPVENNTQEEVPAVLNLDNHVEPVPMAEEMKPVELVTPAPVVESFPQNVVIPETMVPHAVETPAVTLTPEFTAPVVETINNKVEEPAVAIYGGVNPVEERVIPAVDSVPRPIYGGANPLENTAPIPTAEVKEAYSGNVAVDEPSLAPVVEIPTIPTESFVAPVMEAPKIDSMAPVIPTVSPVIPQEPTVGSAQPKEEIETLEF